MSPNVIKKEGFKNMKKTSASCFFKNNQGFSLMEMLIYVGILGIVASVATGIFLSVTKVQTEQSAQVEISGQLNFAMQTIQRLIRNSSLVDITPGTPTTSLTLRMKDSAVDPTTIYLENGRIYVKEGANGTPQSITSDRVVVDSLEFKKLTQYPGKDIVQIDLAMSAANKVEGSTIRRSLRSAVSRVSAATFDSDLIPGVDNTYSVGTSNRWKNASFSGNVGIGVTTLLNKLDVAGGVAIGSYAGVNTAPSNGLIVSDNVGIGTTSPGAKLEVKAGTENQASPVTAIKIWGPNQPTNANSAQDLIWGFSAAGSAKIRAYRDSSWGTHLQFLTNANSQGSDSPQIRMHISENGNVGIGTTTPGEKLEVNGNIKLSGATPTYKITNVAAPTANSDVATKAYVDASPTGKLVWKGYSTTTYQGNFGGTRGANDKCNATYPGSHWASYDELMALGTNYPYTYPVWIRDAILQFIIYSVDTTPYFTPIYRHGYRTSWSLSEPAQWVCNNYTSAYGGYYGSTLATSTLSSDNLNPRQCNEYYRLACVAYE